LETGDRRLRFGSNARFHLTRQAIQYPTVPVTFHNNDSFNTLEGVVNDLTTVAVDNSTLLC